MNFGVMMLLHQLLDHDLHRASKGVDASPLMLETPARDNFIPAVVSSSHAGRFIISRHLTKEKRIRSGVFTYDPDRIDDLINPLLKVAYDLSVQDKFSNRFRSVSNAFDHIKKTAGTGAHPHILLMPLDWPDELLNGETSIRSGTVFYRDFCRVVRAKVDFATFFSRPDYVGMYTQFLGGNASIFLHNVKQGIAFINSAKI